MANSAAKILGLALLISVFALGGDTLAQKKENCKKQFISGAWVLVCCDQFGTCRRV